MNKKYKYKHKNKYKKNNIVLHQSNLMERRDKFKYFDELY